MTNEEKMAILIQELADHGLMLMGLEQTQAVTLGRAFYFADARVRNNINIISKEIEELLDVE